MLLVKKKLGAQYKIQEHLLRNNKNVPSHYEVILACDLQEHFFLTLFEVLPFMSN